MIISLLPPMPLQVSSFFLFILVASFYGTCTTHTHALTHGNTINYNHIHHSSKYYDYRETFYISLLMY